MVKKRKKEKQAPGWFISPDKHLTLRTSLFKTFVRCPAQCLFRYFKGLIIRPSGAMTFGSCFHETSDYFYTYKLKKGKNRKLSSLQDKFNEEWKDRKKKTDFKEREDPKKMVLLGIEKVLPVYYEERAKVINPFKVEERFNMELPEANATITGQIDLVDDEGIIRDHKCKGKTPAWTEVYNSIQGRNYLMGYENKFGKKAAGFMLDSIIKKKEPEVVESQLIEPTKVLMKTHKQHLIHMVDQMRRGQFIPRPEGFLCSPNFCGYWYLCRKGDWMKMPKTIKVFNENG